MTASATFSTDGLYRYDLQRDLGNLLATKGTCLFVMLNPSTADATTDDPTVRRCCGFARAWGYNRLRVMNLYAYRATSPAALVRAGYPVGPDTDYELGLAMAAEMVVCAWGAHAKHSRVVRFARIAHRRPLHCLGLTKGGHPRHPLYLPATAKPLPYALPLA